jgi:hypothetical protein
MATIQEEPVAFLKGNILRNKFKKGTAEIKRQHV